MAANTYWKPWLAIYFQFYYSPAGSLRRLPNLRNRICHATRSQYGNNNHYGARLYFRKSESHHYKNQLKSLQPPDGEGCSGPERCLERSWLRDSSWAMI